MVEASAAEAEAISATLAAAKARQVNGEVELPDRGDRGAEATPSGKLIPTMIKPDSSSNITPPPGVRLHHRAVSINFNLSLGTKHQSHSTCHAHDLFIEAKELLLILRF